MPQLHHTHYPVPCHQFESQVTASLCQAPALLLLSHQTRDMLHNVMMVRYNTLQQQPATCFQAAAALGTLLINGTSSETQEDN